MRKRTKLIVAGAASGAVLLFAATRLYAASRRRARKFWDFAPPLDRVYVTSGWGEDRSYRSGTHVGIDMRGKVGDPVYSIGDGVVTRIRNTYAGSHAGMYVEILHEGGLFSRYLHLDKNRVKVGQHVKRGQRIGDLGASGKAGRYAFSPHLHFALMLDERMLPLYVEKFGKPTTGFLGRRRMSGTEITAVTVPSEPLIPGTYRQRVIARAAALRVPMHPAAIPEALAAPSLSSASCEIL